MASDPDDNPFERASGWPKMPQASFRVGSLPRAGEPDASSQSAPPPEQRAITPAFVRPTEGAFTPAFTRPIAAPPQPLRRAEPQPAVSIPPPSPPSAPIATPVIAVAPQRAVRRPRRWPGLIAAAVGLAGLAGLVLLFTQRQPAVVLPATPAVAAPAQAVAQPPTLATAPVATPPPLAATPQRLARTSLAKPHVPAPKRGAATAAQEALDAPVLALPPAAPERPPLRVDGAPNYQPPAPPDPNAPITTRTPYS
jgi:hypothetical protein